VQGGSTITQQLVKNRYFPDAEETLERKADEALLAMELERATTKDEILVDYLNTVYFGAGAYGIKAAATDVLRRRRREADAPAGRAARRARPLPRVGVPHTAPERALAERRRVLDAMAAEGASIAAEPPGRRAAPSASSPPPPAGDPLPATSSSS
jgi:membrane carboxypeptidase/penicillin-binding protein